MPEMHFFETKTQREPIMNKMTRKTIVFPLAIILLVLSFIEGAGMRGKTVKGNAGNGSPSESDTSGVLLASVDPDPSLSSGQAAGQVIQPIPRVEKLTGEPHPGVSFGFAYTAESISLLSGGLSNRASHYLDNVDLQFEIDTEGLGLWAGGTLSAYFLSNSGADPSLAVGDAQVTSNIEAYDSQRLYELWYNQALFGGALEILVGLHDLNSEYYTVETGGLFNNSSFGIGANLSGNVSVGIFNVAALGTRVKVAPMENLVILASVYDGDPGDPAVNYNGITIDWDPSQGLMSIIEAQLEPQTAGFESGIPQAYRLGGWYHSADFELIGTDTTEIVQGNYGVYFSIDQPISRSVSGFVHGGFAVGNRSPVPSYLGMGFQITPGKRWLVSQRFEETFGLAIGSAFIQEENNNELVIEATWQIQINEYLSLKPDLQYVINPGGVSSSKNVLVFSLRTEIGL